MTCCLPRCCIGCRDEVRTERRNLKKEEASINACQTGPFPEMVDDASEPENKPPVADLPFDLEEGDRVWATGLLPEVQYVQATSTISQRLAESFSKQTESNPTLPTGGMGSSGPIPDYVKMFGQVFSEETSEPKVLGPRHRTHTRCSTERLQGLSAIGERASGTQRIPNRKPRDWPHTTVKVSHGITSLLH